MRWLACLLGLALSACGASSASSGEGPFSLSFRERDAVPLQKVHSHARAAARVRPVALSVGVTATEVIGQPLDGSSGFRAPLSAIQEPLIAGTVVVVVTAAEFVALDARRGQVLWKHPSQGRELFGIDDDGKRTVLTFGPGPSVAMVKDRAGDTLMEVEAPHLLGGPAISGPYVFIPWQDQFVSVFEVDGGKEAARLVLPRQASHAVSHDGQVYFGEDALLRFDKEVAEGGPERGMWQRPDPTGLPGAPQWFSRGRRSQTLPLGARAFTRLFAKPAEGPTEQGPFATTYFRLAMGFEPLTRALSWVVTFDRPVAGGAAARGGFVFCTSDGVLTEVGARDGSVRRIASLGGQLEACSVAAGEHVVVTSGGEVASHHEQLSRAVLLPDPQMSAAQVFLLSQMQHLTEPTLTETLIELLSRPHPPPDLAALARALLSKRETGAEYMLAALKRPYDFLAGVDRVPPVGPIATALSNLDEPEAAPLLATHLNEPTYDAQTTRQLAKALSHLARREQVPELTRFFSLNHATSEGLLAEAVNDVADTLLRLDDRRAQAMIQKAARSAMTHPVIKTHLEEMFDWEAAKAPAPRGTAKSVGKVP